MAIWKVTAKRKFDNGVVSFSPGMNVEVQTSTVSTSFWTQSQYRRAIAERFVSQYGLKCPVAKFEQQVNNANFDYSLVSK
ncbi:MAG: hypothetical protein HDS94_04900 [Bacteroidales bacterium]|nr:hypothetical protein [Bacteroidales bacterium]